MYLLAGGNRRDGSVNEVINTFKPAHNILGLLKMKNFGQKWWRNMQKFVGTKQKLNGI
jgi:hypothetical protein